MTTEQPSSELVWETVFKQCEWGKYPPEDLIRFVSSHFYQIQNRGIIKILELGCGPGANLWYLAKEGFSPYGIDISKTAISRAAKRLNTEFPTWNGQLVVGDFLTLPFENDYFDAVIDLESVYCNSYENSRAIYKEAARVCKLGGYIYSRTFASDTYGDKTGINLGHNAWQATSGPFLGKGYARFTDQSEIPELFLGFKILELELISRTVNNMQNEIKEWSIIGIKVSEKSYLKDEVLD